MRRALKWMLFGWVALFVASLIVIVVAAALHEPVESSSILRLRFDGELPETGTGGLAVLLDDDRPLTLRQATSAVRYAARDERIKGLVLEIKDPQLSLAHLQELEQAMAVYRAAGKWSAAHLETAGEVGGGNG